MRRVAFVSLLCLSALSCSAATSGSGALTGKSRDYITEEEIASRSGIATYAWDVISQLRPHFLSSHGPASLREPDPPRATVYVDELYYGPLESLKSLTAVGIKNIQVLSPYDATTRFGTNHVGGAILIRTH